MTSFRYRVKDIKPGDLVQYRPLGMARTEQNAALFVALGTVADTELLTSSMAVTVDWDTPSIPQVIDVNDVEVLKARTGHA
ncbi:hypothetical protein [Paludisphaera mucosa]|uniref:SAF domain-containing protein n=1 Tax=Paludisphaera mucosa TaxID=3030827 RepID=A0ABT6FFT4_9BACT|nr:hypothetical protein [Paludisphaera mucosa]MDG3006428.1 hypothetical protein [Paludisphaera mucosa]